MIVIDAFLYIRLNGLLLTLQNGILAWYIVSAFRFSHLSRTNRLNVDSLKKINPNEDHVFHSGQSIAVPASPHRLLEPPSGATAHRAGLLMH